MNKSKVSVIVPVYNTEKYLRECLDSLVNQTLQEIQIVIVNDGSTDTSWSIIQEYASRYPEKIVAVTQENQGQGVARNLALSYCNGEYIGFLDSDDYAKPDMYEKMYASASRSGADYVACAYTTFYTEGEEQIVIEEYKSAPPYSDYKKLFFDAEVAPWRHLFSASMILENGVRFSEGVVHEDTTFYACLVPFVRNVVHIQEPLVMHRKHRQSTVSTMTKIKVAQIFTVMDDVNAWYETINTKDDLSKEQEYFCVRILLCSSVERIAKVEKRAERRMLIRETLEYIREHYPNYRKNPYFKNGLKNLYIRTACRLTVSLTCAVKRFQQRRGKHFV